MKDILDKIDIQTISVIPAENCFLIKIMLPKKSTIVWKRKKLSRLAVCRSIIPTYQKTMTNLYKNVFTVVEQKLESQLFKFKDSTPKHPC